MRRARLERVDCLHELLPVDGPPVVIVEQREDAVDEGVVLEGERGDALLEGLLVDRAGCPAQLPHHRQEGSAGCGMQGEGPM